MRKARIRQQGHLRLLHGLGLGHAGRGERRIEGRHHLGGGGIIDQPQCRHGGLRTGLDGDPGQTKRGTVVACRGLAGAQGEEFEGSLTQARDADVVGAINRTMTKPGQPPVSTLAILDAIERGKTGLGPSGHQWPPIISLSEAGGYSFTIGSAELSTPFHDQLVNKTITEILENIKKYDVDVIEVVGHTDEQPIGNRPSNLDRDLLSVLNSTSKVAKLIPADNAGLGLARAVSVVSVLRHDPRLAPYKLIPLSGAQLVNTDETLATQGAHGDIPQRRRIEIRLRKSVPHETAASIVTAPVVAIPKPRPLPRPGPLLLTPATRPAPRSYPQTGTPTAPTGTAPR